MPVNKYNIYIICKNEDIFNKKAHILNDKYKSKICHIQWIPAEYLTLTQCNQPMLKKLKTMYNTKKKSIIAKLGCTAAHRKALLAIYSNQTHNNLILEEDADLMSVLPMPPGKSCYMGGWIVPPLISQTGKVDINLKPNKGINKVDYDKFKIITTHALFIKDHMEATELLDMTIEPEQIKPYDIFLAGNQFFKDYYYPAVFVQGSHKSDIDDKGADVNYYRTYNYGLTKPNEKKEKGKLKKGKLKKTRRKKHKGGSHLSWKREYEKCEKKCNKYKPLSKQRNTCYNACKYMYGNRSRKNRKKTKRLKKRKSLLKKR
jgi:hypothetical protein